MNTHDHIDVRLIAADEAFARELPDLLRQYGGGWVAYHGTCRMGVAATKGELYDRCLGQGLERGEFLIRSIEPEEEEMKLGPRVGSPE